MQDHELQQSWQRTSTYVQLCEIPEISSYKQVALVSHTKDKNNTDTVDKRTWCYPEDFLWDFERKLSVRVLISAFLITEWGFWTSAESVGH